MKEGKTEGNGKEETFSSMTEGEILERSLYSKLTTGEAWHNDKSGQSAYTHTYTRAQALKTIMMSNKKHPDSTYLTKPPTSGLPLGKKTHLHRTT